MTAEIIEFGKHRVCRAATGPGTVLGIRPASDELSDAELGELNEIFPTALSRKALFGEAYEQALIEMNNGPVDLAALPPIEVLSPEALRRADALVKVRQLKLMVERTAELLRDYLAAYRRLRS